MTNIDWNDDLKWFEMILKGFRWFEMIEMMISNDFKGVLSILNDWNEDF